MRSVYRRRWLFVVGLLIFGCVTPAFAQQTYEYVRSGPVAHIRAVQLPPLIARLASTPEPTELSPPEFAQLKAYLVATSRPRRMEKDQFYRHILPTRESKEVSTLTTSVESHTISLAALEDPINESRVFPELQRARMWERLRIHFMYNEELQKSPSYWTSYQMSAGSEAEQPRMTVAVQTGTEIRWFAVDDCLNCWSSRQPNGGALYRVAADSFVLLDAEAVKGALPARFVSMREAVTWLATQGHAIPAKLAQTASEWHLAAGDEKVFCVYWNR